MLNIGEYLYIYPYWNLNSFLEKNGGNSEKLYIYPYWNLNAGVQSFTNSVFALYIYPYWNLNNIVTFISVNL